MHRFLLAALVAASLAGLSACDGFVNDVPGPIDQVPTDSLDNPANLPFLLTGLQQRSATAYGNAVLLADGLSDAYLFADGTSGATFPTYIEIDNGQILLDNNSVDGLYNGVNELRAISDDLVERVETRIEFGPDQATLRDEALYAGHLYGGLGRYLLATYFGLEERRGGGTIDAGPFIPSDALYAQAIERFETARGFAEAGSYDERVANSLIARAHLYAGDLSAADAAAAAGLAAGDAPFEVLYNAQTNNPVWAQAGRGRTQFAAAARFADDGDDVTPTEGFAEGFVRQALYLEDAAPIVVIDAEEVALIRAEAALDAGDAGGALAFVNAARGALEPLDALDLDGLVEQRDVLLFARGQRLVDQRRFDRWHLGDGTWQFLPITQGERNANPNL